MAHVTLVLAMLLFRFEPGCGLEAMVTRCAAAQVAAQVAQRLHGPFSKLDQSVLEWLVEEPATATALQKALLHPGGCACNVTRARRSTISRERGKPSGVQVLVVVSTSSAREVYVRLQLDEWLREYDHLIVSGYSTPRREHFEVGLEWGSTTAHRTIAGVVCAHARRPHEYDWMALIDDDTILSVPRLVAALEAVDAQPSQPLFFGARIDSLRGPGVPADAAAASTIMSKPRSAGEWPTQLWREMGWPFGGLGMVLSRAAADSVSRIGVDCLRCLTCPVFGATQGGRLRTKAEHRAFRVGNMTRADAALGFGRCAGLQRAPPACETVDVQLAGCVGQAVGLGVQLLGPVPVWIPAVGGHFSRPWSKHLRYARALGNVTEFRQAMVSFLEGTDWRLITPRNWSQVLK